MIDVCPYIRRAMSLLVLLLIVGGAAVAQQVEVETTVEHIAGANMYLDAGQDAGLHTGDTLTVHRGGEVLGPVVIVSSTPARSVVTFAGSPFPVTRGDQLRLTGGGATPRAAPDEDVPSPQAIIEDRPSLLEAPPGRVRRRRVQGIEVHGRWYVDLNALRSITEPSAAPATTRTFSTPTAGLRATVAHLPGDVQANVNLRASYRYSSDDVIQPVRSVRVYQGSLSKRFEAVPLQVEAGRFFNRYEAYSGYWDGALVRWQPGPVAVGVAGGFEPDRANEGVSTELPKAGAFLNYEVRRNDAWYVADLAVGEMRPRNDLPVHTYGGFEQRLRWRRLRLSQDLHLDRNPETERWVVTRFQVRGALPLHRRVTVHLRYALRQPYAYWRAERVISYRRDQAGAGLDVRLGAGAAGGAVTQTRLDVGYTTWTYSAYLRWSRLPGGLGGRLSGSYWTHGSQATRHLAAGLDRTWGTVRTQVSYTLYTTDGLHRDRLVSHLAGVSVHLPLAGTLYASVQGRAQFGQQLRSTSLFTSLWMSF